MSIETRLIESEQVLRDLGLPDSVCKRKVAKLTFLALCNLKPDDNWESATRGSKSISKDIVSFVNDYYEEEYAPNTRESFRKLAIKPFLEFNFIDLNPDDTSLKSTSSLTHYAITELILETIKQFNTENWSKAVEDFKYKQYIKSNNFDYIENFKISNFKTINNIEIELGKINVFIGANGVGKSNILEALAVASASNTNEFNFEGLGNRGVRYTRPNLMLSSFLGRADKQQIEMDISIRNNADDTPNLLKFRLRPADKRNIYTNWENRAEIENINFSTEIIRKIAEDDKGLIEKLRKSSAFYHSEPQNQSTYVRLIKKIISTSYKQIKNNEEILDDYAIFDINTKSLRGINIDSRKSPLGINGEGLDLLLSTLNKEQLVLLRKYLKIFSWCDDFIIDKTESFKKEGLKLGRSFSNLYFVDNKMKASNNTISVEASNEGILHVLFYLTLFISDQTPKLFGIENIETALNPGLCRFLIKTLCEISIRTNKQSLITTHNPAIIDGMNLFDDSQRLFVVSRNDDGETKIRRIKFKKDLSDKNAKLSDMWLNGLIGALPDDF